MILNHAGQIVEAAWLSTPHLRRNVELDAFVVMPNHFHAVLVITDRIDATSTDKSAPTPSTLRSPSQTLGAVVRGFKATATKQIGEFLGVGRAPLWQRNYYERIIRNEAELQRVRQYIEDNPARWSSDSENPSFTKHRVPPR